MPIKLIDETGNTYGSLTVIKSIRTETMRKTGWLCQCTCGNTIICSGSDLRTGKRSSCGKHCNSIKNEIGKQYGFLTVIQQDPTPALQFPDKSVHWICKCKACGNQISISGRSLRNKQAQSCGCLKSSGELAISLYLNENNIKYKKEYSFKDLIYKRPLRFDFALFDNDKLIGLIEFQGRQHFKDIKYFQNDSFEERKLKDEKKVEYCKSHNIPLLKIIPYDLDHSENNDYNSVGSIIEKFLQEIKGDNDVKIFDKHLRSLQSSK